MKKSFLAILFASTLLIVPQETKAQELSFQMFYSSLSPYGQWMNIGSYGMCWRPVGVPTWWRPYTYGHWVWTEYGWTWVSDYPWGWAVFHYGRWMLDPSYGWVWVPGYVWAPAWVEWRWGGGYAGWAPLPPGFHFRVDVVVGPNNGDFGVAVGGWSFIRADEIASARYRFVEGKAIPRVIGNTRNVTRFRFTSRGVYNVGLSKEQVERVTRRRIETVGVVRTTEVGRERVIGNQFHIYSPAPFKPQMRSEQEVIQRERVYQHPSAKQTPSSPPARSRAETAQPRTRVEKNKPTVEPRREIKARPKEEMKPKGKENSRERETRQREDKGPKKRH